MPQTRENFSLFNQNDVQGLVTEHVAKGLRITPFLEMQNTGADNFVWVTEDYTPQGAIDAGVQELPIKRAPGSELRVVRTSGVTPDAKPLLMTGFRYIVETERIEKAPYTIERDIKRLAYSIGKTIETDVVTEMAAKANATAATVNDSTWNSSSKIDEDIIEMQANFFNDSLPDVLTGLFYEKVNFQELRNFVNSILPMAGFNDAGGIDFLGSNHMYGGSAMSHGTAYGFDLNNPPVTVAYGTESGAFNPNVLEGMEGYTPIINVMINRDQESDRIPRVTEIYMAAKYTVAVEEPNALLKQTGL